MPAHLSRLALPLVLLLAFLAPPTAAIDTQDTRLLAQPAISETHVAFVYAEDLWVAKLDGSDARRLTVHHGSERFVRFSPDGQHLAFSAEYDGNMDVYTVPISGGVPRRLTWHPGPDAVWDFTPTGEVLLGSIRFDATRMLQLFTVPLEGGFPELLPVRSAWAAAFSPDGHRLAYNPDEPAFLQWKGYRGGTHSRIWLHDLRDHSVVEIPQGEGDGPGARANDTDPMWIGDKVYFRSDRNGEINLFSFDPAHGEITQLTHHEDFPVVSSSSGGGRIVYEQGGYLHIYEPADGTSDRLEIGIATDLLALRERWAEGDTWIRDATLSPSGARAAFEYRGEIVTVPAEKGDPRNLTQTPGAHERSPAWSPDGSTLAYFSDVSGEYAIHLMPQDGRGEARAIPLDGAGFYEDPIWSPDGEHLSFVDNSWSLYVVEVASGKVEKIHSEILYGPFRTLRHAWSPDSKWIAYTGLTEVNIQVVHLYSLEEKRSHALTEGLADVTEPVFDANGKYLYFLASTNAGPLRAWFSQANFDMRVTHALYLAVLPSGEPSPLAKESDEETAESSKTAAGKKDGMKTKDTEHQFTEDDDTENDDASIKINFDSLHERIVALPVEPGAYRNLQAGEEGKIFYIATESEGGIFGSNSGKLKMYDLKKREEKTLSERVAVFELSADHKKILARVGQKWVIAPAGQEINSGQHVLSTEGIRVRVEPRAEWEQIFHEAWRINRDYFYDPGMHGANWPAMREKYSVFLPHLAVRSDLNQVLRWMSSEISVGHHRVNGGDSYAETDNVPAGLLGADYEIADERYRFKKIYGGLNWNPGLRSPLTEPGVEVVAGEYLLAVDGRELTADENLFSRFENTAGRIVELTVGSSPDLDSDGTRVVKAVPIESESALRNRDWVEGNLRRVDDATDGRVAYVYVPNTAGAGHTYFKRYFFPQSHKDAIIVDERYNGGGLLADYYIDILRRPHISYWAMRYGGDFESPFAAIHGPKVMLINEQAGSGGDLLPWMFRNLEMGPLVGRPTWGGLVGILGFPVLLDGGRITAPNFAIWTEDGFVVENVGVPPDIEVEMEPADVATGRDTQLEKAIAVALEMLEKDPPKTVKRPPYPVRAPAASRKQ